MAGQLSDLLDEVRAGQQHRDASGYLGGIAQTIQLIARQLESEHPDAGRIVQLAASIGRVVTDDGELAESPLGGRLLQFVNDMVQRFGTASPLGSRAGSQVTDPPRR